MLTGHTRPSTPEQRAQPVHGREEVAAVLLHHREQQVAARVPGQAVVMFQRRQARQQHPPCFPFVPRERQRDFQDVPGRQHAQLIAKLAGAAAAVEHRDDRVQREPGIGFEPAEQAGEAGAAAHAADVQLLKLHLLVLSFPTAGTRPSEQSTKFILE